LYAGIERIWTAACVALRLVLWPKPAIEAWSPAAGRVLVIAPHPDDETIGCGGAMVLHQLAGDEVAVVIVTDGGASGSASAPVRDCEARAAASVLGGVWQALRLPEGEWSETECRCKLHEVINDLRPTVIYAPSCVDFHPQHLQIAHELAAVLTELSDPVCVRVYEVGVPLTPVLTNRIAVLGEAGPIKERALAAYSTQKLSLQAVCRLQRYNRRLYRVSGSLEVFYELTSAEYVSLMTRGHWRTDKTSPFRGIRGRPFLDPLIYIVGMRARYALRVSESKVMEKCESVARND
jgi:LmbE family N-acetylglucosaminyl deacetylase